MKTAHHVAHTSDGTIADLAGERAKEYVDTGVDAYKALSKRAQGAGKQVDQYVRTNPWMVIGAAAGAGLLIGLMMRRR